MMFIQKGIDMVFCFQENTRLQYEHCQRSARFCLIHTVPICLLEQFYLDVVDVGKISESKKLKRECRWCVREYFAVVLHGLRLLESDQFFNDLINK